MFEAVADEAKDAKKKTKTTLQGCPLIQAIGDVVTVYPHHSSVKHPILHHQIPSGLFLFALGDNLGPFKTDNKVGHKV